MELKVIIVLLPVNATHLIQPLDIVIFKPFETVLKRGMEEHMIEKAVISFSKNRSAEIPSRAWEEGIDNNKDNIISGFENGGLWPLSFLHMRRRRRLCCSGGIDKTGIFRVINMNKNP